MSVSRVFVVLGLCLCLGEALVVWDGLARVGKERSRAQGWARNFASALESSLVHALSADESLAAMVRQSAGRGLLFPQAGTELMAACPGLIALELQPGGVTSDVVPRAGNEKLLGINLLSDPSVKAAIQSRQMILVGPRAFPRGQFAVVGRLPVFLRDARGKEVFWGLISATVNLSDLVARTKLDHLSAQGYRYNFYAVSPPTIKAVSLAHEGDFAVAGTWQESFKAGGLEFRLAVVPRAGWIPWTPLLLEGALVALAVSLAGFGLHSRHRIRQLEAVNRESAAHSQQEKAQDAQTAEQLRTTTTTLAKELRAAREANASLSPRLQELQSKIELHQARSAQLENQLREEQKISASELAAAHAIMAQLRAQLIEAKEVQPHAEDALTQSEIQPAADPTAPSPAAIDSGDLVPTPVGLEPAPLPSSDLPESAPVDLAPSSGDGIGFDRTDEPKLAKEESAVVGVDPIIGLEPISTAVPEAEPEPEELESDTALSEATEAESTPEGHSAGVSSLESVSPTPAKNEKPVRRRRNVDQSQLSLFDEPALTVVDLSSAKSAAPPESTMRPAEEPHSDPAQSIPAIKRKPVPAPPLNLLAFKKAANVLYVLLAEADPGAKDCLADNRKFLQAAFVPDAFSDFEKQIKSSQFEAALELLVKAARRHKINF